MLNSFREILQNLKSLAFYFVERGFIKFDDKIDIAGYQKKLIRLDGILFITKKFSIFCINLVFAIKFFCSLFEIIMVKRQLKVY